MEVDGQPSPTGGREKPAMVMIKDSAARHVCFTKRRKGLFKKICELSTLCGADSLAFVTSTAGKLYSIGTSDVSAAVGRFLLVYGRGDADGGQPPEEDRDDDAAEMMSEQDRQIIGKLHREAGELEKKSSELRELRSLMQRSLEEKSSVLPHRWGGKIGDLPIPELEGMLVALEGLPAKMGIDLLEEMRQRSVSVSNITGNIALGSTSFGPVNVAYPMMRYYPPPLPQPMNPCSFVTTSRGPANLPAPVTVFNLNPSSRVQSSLNFSRSPPMLHYPSLMTPAAAHSGGPSSSCFRPPAGPPRRLPPREPGTPGIPVTTFCAPPSRDGASWNLSSTTPVQLMPATRNQVNALGFTDSDAAPATCSAISLNPPMLFSSSTTLPTTLQLKEANSRMAQPAHCNLSNAIIGATPPCMTSNGTTKSLDFQSDAAGEECSLIGGGDAFPSPDSGNIPWELLDIPPDFDFARDWST